MRLSAFPACALGAMFSGIFVGPVSAQTVTPLLDARLRYETVKEEGFDRDAQAVTLRVRPGIEIGKDGWSALVQAEATTALVENYNSGTNGLTQFPLVADPRNVELDRAQVRYAGAHGLAATLGRQRIELLDRRFVGIAPFRQNERTFDAARLQWGASKGWSVDLSYAWSVRTTNGRRGFGSRPTAIGGDNMFALVSHGSALGTVTGFAFLVDQDEAAVQGYRLSSQTYGVRFSGSYPIGSALKGGIIASYALQSDYANNPNDFAASYSLVEERWGTVRSLESSAGKYLAPMMAAPLPACRLRLARCSAFRAGWTDFRPHPRTGCAIIMRRWRGTGAKWAGLTRSA